MPSARWCSWRMGGGGHGGRGKITCPRVSSSSDHSLVGKWGHVHMEMMVRSHVRMESNSFLA